MLTQGRCTVTAAPATGQEDSGFTLIEVLVVMVVSAILLGLSTTGWMNYRQANARKSAVTQVVSALRNAQQAAYAESLQQCVRFSTATSTFTVWKSACGSGSQVGGTRTLGSARVRIVSAAFTQSDNSTTADVTFTPRGTASPGTVVLTGAGTNRTYTIDVEGLTGRVSTP